jgi:hypothetical protein
MNAKQNEDKYKKNKIKIKEKQSKTAKKSMKKNIN